MSPKKGGQQPNKDNFFNRPSGTCKQIPHIRCLAGGLPRHEAPTPEMCTAAPAAFQVTTWKRRWDEAVVPGEYSFKMKDGKGHPTCLFLHGKGNTSVLSWRPGLVPLLGQGSATWCQKLAFLDSSPYPAATPRLYANPPTSHLTLVPDFRFPIP